MSVFCLICPQVHCRAVNVILAVIEFFPDDCWWRCWLSPPTVSSPSFHNYKVTLCVNTQQWELTIITSLFSVNIVWITDYNMIGNHRAEQCKTLKSLTSQHQRALLSLQCSEDDRPSDKPVSHWAEFEPFWQLWSKPPSQISEHESQHSISHVLVCVCSKNKGIFCWQWWTLDPPYPWLVIQDVYIYNFSFQASEPLMISCNTAVASKNELSNLYYDKNICSKLSHHILTPSLYND